MSKTNEFEQHISDWLSSGLSKASYCKKHSLTYWCFLYYYKKHEASQEGFSQIKINPKISAMPNASGVEYHFADGSYFVFPAGYSTSMIRSLIGL